MYPQKYPRPHPHNKIIIKSNVISHPHIIFLRCCVSAKNKERLALIFDRKIAMNINEHISTFPHNQSNSLVMQSFIV